MQTWLPYPSFTDSVGVLDTLHLGKQRVETMQIMRTLTGYYSKPYLENLPLARAWRGHESALLAYQTVTVAEWRKRGNTDTCLEKTIDTYVAWRTRLTPLAETMQPEWMGDDRMHEGMRAALIRKSPGKYQHLFPATDPGAPFYWPGVDEPLEIAA